MLNLFPTRVVRASRVDPCASQSAVVPMSSAMTSRFASAWSWVQSHWNRVDEEAEFASAVERLTELLETAQTVNGVEDALRGVALRLAGAERAATREEQLGSAQFESYESASTSVRVAAPAGQDGRFLLELSSNASRCWPESLMRRLEILVRIAAARRRLLVFESVGEGSPRPAWQSASFLRAILPYALAQSRRRRESLSLFCIGLDRLAAIRDLHGREIAEKALAIVAATIVKTLRSSDMVARLDDGRLAAVLPNAGGHDALTVAEAIRRAVAKAGTATVDMPILTVSIGVACYPDDGEDAETLIKAANAGLSKARGLGRDRVAVPDHVTSDTMLIDSPRLVRTVVCHDGICT